MIRSGFFFDQPLLLQLLGDVEVVAVVRTSTSPTPFVFAARSC